VDRDFGREDYVSVGDPGRSQTGRPCPCTSEEASATPQLQLVAGGSCWLLVEAETLGKP